MREITDLIIPMLRKIQADIAVLKSAIAELKTRLTRIESQVAALTMPETKQRQR